MFTFSGVLFAQTNIDSEKKTIQVYKKDLKKAEK
jgi:hypothetical protein